MMPTVLAYITLSLSGATTPEAVARDFLDVYLEQGKSVGHLGWKKV